MIFEISGFNGVKNEAWKFVQLLGYCVDENSHILTYEFASNVSLHDILHGILLFFSDEWIKNLMVPNEFG